MMMTMYKSVEAALKTKLKNKTTHNVNNTVEIVRMFSINKNFDKLDQNGLYFLSRWKNVEPYVKVWDYTVGAIIGNNLVFLATLYLKNSTSHYWKI